jgi:hypothetical protein
MVWSTRRAYRAWLTEALELNDALVRPAPHGPRTNSSLAVLAAQQSSGPPRKRLEPFKGSTCVQVADQSCWTGCMRELEHSRFELDVARRPGRVGAPVHASLCAVIFSHPPSTRDLIGTQNSSVAQVAGAGTGFPVRPRPGLQTCTWNSRPERQDPARRARGSAPARHARSRSPGVGDDAPQTRRLPARRRPRSAHRPSGWSV